MRLIFITLIIICIIPSICISQCISGDCDNGTGVYISKEKTRMEGNWKNGQLNGSSKLFFSSGASYDGKMIMGVKSGFGKYIFSNGNYYEGIWKNDKQFGAGKSVTTKGYVEEGNYVDDTLVGLVTITYNNMGYAKRKNDSG